MIDDWHILRINAEPWKVGDLSLGRRNGKLYPKIGPNHQLVAFQEAVKDELKSWEEARELPLEFKLTFFIWRQRASYQGEKRRIRKNQVDATNIQKALEDALQGVLFDNDRRVRDIRTVVVEQSPTVEPCIVIHMEPWEGFDRSEIPDEFWLLIDNPPKPQPKSNVWPPPNSEDLFPK